MPEEPSDQAAAGEGAGRADAPALPLTETQQRILVALCRPASEGSHYSTPATNQEIGEEVFLSVDAVKAHLRALYRKFGIEDLPQNQKRARLVELTLGGDYLQAQPVEDGTPVPPPASPLAPSRGGGWSSRRIWPIVAGLAVAVAVVLAVLALTGGFDSDDSPSTGVPAYRTAVRGYCELAFSGAASGGGAGSQAERAQEYLEVIETMRGRLETLPPPAGAGPALDRFREGLATASTYDAIVARGKLEPGGRGEATAVAELTFAAGQVQAGALGYELGPKCVALGDLVARSARNAVSP